MLLVVRTPNYQNNLLYDPSNRLTEANYSNNDYYHYTYDAVGNRKTQESMVGGLPSTNSYNYDHANRLTDVNGVLYTWDDNGNLLNDGVNAYTYDAANRLKTLTQGANTSTFAYNGLGDRLQQVVNGNTTNYTLDINTSLSEALSDGQTDYIYGLDNLAQVRAGGTEYFLGDALNSARQLVTSSAQITLVQSYDPFGNGRSHVGNGQSIYGYISEPVDPSGLVYLRARYYAPNDGRFTSRDTWGGDASRPLSLNKWSYVEGNPVNYTDPTGNWPCVLDLSGTAGWTGKGWTDQDIRKRVDVAEKYVSRTSDYMDTYVAAGIAVQCAGWDELWSDYSGLGIAQITRKQAETESGKIIKDVWGKFRGYGLCPAEELEKPLDPMNTKDAAILMKREIQLVTNECKGCKSTDIYIAAGLAQNGPGFSYKEMQFLGELPSADQEKYLIKMDWFGRFATDLKRNNGVNTKTQLNRFTLVIKELQNRGWFVPMDDQINFSWTANQVNP